MRSFTSSFDKSRNTAKARVPVLSFMRELAAGGAAAIAMMVCMAALNAYIDPFDARLSPWRAKIDRWAVYRVQNTALWAAIEHERIKNWNADVVIVGESRADQLTPVDGINFRTANVDGRYIVRVSFGGAFIKEALDMFEAYEDRFEPGLVIIGVPYELFVSERRSRVAAAVTEARNAGAYLVNLRTASLGVISFPGHKQRNDALQSDPEGASKEFQDGLLRRYIHTPYNDAVLNADILLRPVVERLNAKGTRVVLYIPPMSDPVLAELKKQRARHYDFRRELKKIAPVYDASGYDPSTPRRKFMDGVHVEPEEGEGLLRDVLDFAQGLKGQN